MAQSERDRLIDYLSRLVADGAMAEGDAAALVAQYDAGTLERRWLVDLPQAPTVQENRFDDALTPIALALLLLLLGRRAQRTALASGPQMIYPVPGALQVLAGGVSVTLPAQMPPMVSGLLGAPPVRPLSVAHNWQIGRIEAEFDGLARHLAGLLGDGRIGAETFRTQMLTAVQHHLQQQALLGSGRTWLLDSEKARIEGVLQEQSGYLSRFADTAHTEALSTPQLANRATLYGGSGRQLALELGEEASLALGPGWVIRYVSMDDPSRCLPCNNATGYYLIGSNHPVPVRDCRGGRRCRCRLVVEYNPAWYARLTGQVYPP